MHFTKYREGWNDNELRLLDEVKTFDELADVALTVLDRMANSDEDIWQICGPMSTGGHGSLESNMSYFVALIDIAMHRGLNVFNQLPCTKVMLRLHTDEHIYCMTILDVFYRRIFESGKIKATLFTPLWQTSLGASWERKLLAKLRIPMRDYPSVWILNPSVNHCVTI